MADFSDELDGYLKARTATQDQENRATAAANAAADALFGHSFAHPHPDGFLPTQDAPAFAQHPVTHMWHDATTGTFSYYDAGSETYIPVEGPDSPHPHPQHQEQHQHQQQQQYQQQQEYHAYSAVASYDSPGGYHIDPYTGYPVEAEHSQGQNYEAPPESDATLRLCVLSSKILKVAGVILLDASGISFGRDRPLSGQGKRVRMVEMEISRFHGSIYLDRQLVVPEAQESAATYSHFDSTAAAAAAGTPSVESAAVEASLDESSLTAEKLVKDKGMKTESVETDMAEETVVRQDAESSTRVESKPSSKAEDSSLRNQETSLFPTTLQGEQNQEAEDGEIPDSPPGAGARVLKDREQGEMSDDSESDINGGGKQDATEDQEEEQQRQYREYQRQLEEYQQYYQSMVPPVYVETFRVIDCGSTHGTFLNGQRLSAAKSASKPFPLNHLDQLQLGSTVFEIHAHEEGRICGSCQVTDDNEIEVLDDKNQETDGTKALGADAANGGINSNKNSPKLVGDIKLSREQERIEEMNRLRKKWAGPDRKAIGKRSGGNGGYHDGSGSSTSSPSSDYGASSGYVDRAAKRRQFNQDNFQPIRSGMPDYSATPEVVSGFHVPVAKTNKGHAMLSKMGWKAGTGLGAARQGVVEPVQLLVADKKAGLGSKTIQSQGNAAISASRQPETQAEIARRKARERFAQLK
ncbi:hypothetical protein BG015_001423 [Linnemannia schmuckeri]|uniref:G-patch domain-containing protein n=1 Tax=Linnemannia schmuckeri TaxID=64567 RepID=A0A9P5V6Z5_9FUNG|nr:hypothetical protein BG015_001423 [Linnemannia schmuckeri]